MARSRFWRSLHALRICLAVLTIIAMTLAFGHGADCLALIAKANFGPALLSSVTRFSIVGAIAVLVILMLTALLGRAYCSVVCPLGILQDVFGALLFWRKNRPQPRLFLLRKGVGVSVWSIAFIGGWAIGLRFLDPYTIFGAIAAYGWLPALVLLALVAWRRRFFCNSFCPVGALLACTSVHAPFGLRFTERCVKCGKCVTVCPAGCLDPKAGTIDNGRCIRCLACASACPFGAITYGHNPGFRFPTRRKALTVGGVLAGGAAVGVAAHFVSPSIIENAIRRKNVICPPGAGDAARFASKCTDCRLCVTQCPTEVIKPAGVAGIVHLDYATTGAQCKFDCKRCTEVCPTGALLPLTLAEKQRTRLGLAVIDTQRCRAFNGESCEVCAPVCPAHALHLVRREDNSVVPEVDAERCIGCGACRSACPMEPKAIAVVPPEDGKQTLVPPLPTPHYDVICPPGAGSPQRLRSLCTDCNLCVANCLPQVIQPAGEKGIIHLAFDKGMCEDYCTTCGNVCPTGAITPLDLAIKQRTRLGLAVLEPSICVAFSTENSCGACAEHCPTGALRMKPDAEGHLVPMLTTELCIGCGSCEYPCPIRPIKAIRVHPLTDGVQVLATDRNEYFKATEPTPAPTSDAWLI